MRSPSTSLGYNRNYNWILVCARMTEKKLKVSLSLILLGKDLSVDF